MYFLGMSYTFIGIALVCAEWFVPAIEVMGSTMTVTGRGYTGGDYGRNGESYDCQNKQNKTCKLRGGGGGSYATQGKDGLIEI